MKKINKTNAPEYLREHIHVSYPPHNHTPFEEWFYHNYDGHEGDRIYIDIFWTSMYVNHNYGKDQCTLNRIQHFLDGLDRSKKYFLICQYDDSVLNDLSGLDVLQFNMSKPFDYPLPLIGQEAPYVFNEEKKYLANFIGNMTHPIREHAKTLKGKEGYYISFDRHSPEEYCRIIAQSHFTLCYRGYGINSFRIAEALQYGSTPIYISDIFMQPHNLPISEFGLRLDESNVHQLDELIFWYHESNWGKNNLPKPNLKEVYKEYFSYEGTKNKILNHLKNMQ